MYVPWDSKKSLAPNLPQDINDVLERIDSYCQCMHGAAGAVAGYAFKHFHLQSILPSMMCPETARRAWHLICPRTSMMKVGRLCFCAVKVQEGSAHLLDDRTCRGGGTFLICSVSKGVILAGTWRLGAAWTICMRSCTSSIPSRLRCILIPTPSQKCQMTSHQMNGKSTCTYGHYCAEQMGCIPSPVLRRLVLSSCFKHA